MITHRLRTLRISRPAILLLTGVTAMTLSLPVTSSNRWDLLHWCRSAEVQERSLCNGMLHAALDLTTHKDFTDHRLCFKPDTTLNGVRLEVVDWLEENRITKEQSGLALLGEAIRERFACTH